MRFVSPMSRIVCVTLHCPLRNIRIFYPDKEGKLFIIQNIFGTMVDRLGARAACDPLPTRSIVRDIQGGGYFKLSALSDTMRI